MDTHFLHPRKGYPLPSPTPSRFSVLSTESAEDILDRLHEFPLVPSPRCAEFGGMTVILEDVLTPPGTRIHGEEEGYFPRIGAFKIDHADPKANPGPRPADHNKSNARNSSSSDESVSPQVSEPRSPGVMSFSSTGSSSDSRPATPQQTGSPAGVSSSIVSPVITSPQSRPYPVHADIKHVLSPASPQSRSAGSFLERKASRRALNGFPPVTQPPAINLPPIITTSPTSLTSSAPFKIEIETSDGANSPTSPQSPFILGQHSCDDAASDYSWEARSTMSGQRTPFSAFAPGSSSSGSWPKTDFTHSTSATLTAGTTRHVPLLSSATSAYFPVNTIQSTQEHLASALSSIHAIRVHEDSPDVPTSMPRAEDLPQDCGASETKSDPPSPSMSVFSSLEEDLIPDFLDLGNLNRMSFLAGRPSLALHTVFENVNQSSAPPPTVVRTVSDNPHARTESFNLEDHSGWDYADPIIPSFTPDGPRRAQSASELSPSRAAPMPLVKPTRTPLASYNSETAVPHSSSHLDSHTRGLRRLFSDSQMPKNAGMIRANTHPVLPQAAPMQANLLDAWRQESHGYPTDITTSYFQPPSEQPPSPIDSSEIANALLDEGFARPHLGHSISENPNLLREHIYEDVIHDGSLHPDRMQAGVPFRARAESHGQYSVAYHAVERTLHRSSSGNSSLRGPSTAGGSSLRRPSTASSLAGSQYSSASRSHLSGSPRDDWSSDSHPGYEGATIGTYSQMASSSSKHQYYHTAHERVLRQHGSEDPSLSRQGSLFRRGSPSIRSDASGEPIAELKSKMAGLMKPAPDLTLSHPSSSDPLAHFSATTSKAAASVMSTASPQRKGKAPDPNARHPPNQGAGMSIGLRPKKLKKSASEEPRAVAPSEFVSFMPDDIKAKPAKRRLFGKGLGW